MVRDKVRIRFRKLGDLRLISHHDLMRCFERMLRRADLPYHATQGFNPKPRLVFALPLSLGIVGLDEVADLELDIELPEEEILARLSMQAPPGLEILSVCRIPRQSPSRAEAAHYRLAIPADRAPDAAAAAKALIDSENCWIERSRPQPRRLDIRQYVGELQVTPAALEMRLLVTPGGTVRPQEILEQLRLDDLLEAGAVLERTELELAESPPAQEPAIAEPVLEPTEP